MSALAAESGSPENTDRDEIVRVWEEPDAPEGGKVEIIEGVVTVPPPPSEEHNGTAELVQRRLYTAIPDDWGIYQTLGRCPHRSSWSSTLAFSH